MIARFVLGEYDGRERFISHAARYYMVPVLPKTGTVEDFTKIYIDGDGAPLRYDQKLIVQRYRRVWYDSETDTVVYVFEHEGT